MSLAQRGYVLIVVTAAIAIAGLWSDDPALARGVNVALGSVVLAEVARAHGRDYLPLAEAFG